MANDDPIRKSERIGDMVRIFQRGGAWYANFQLFGRQRRKSLQTTSKKEARRRALLLEADLVAGRYRDQPKPPSVNAVVQEYTTFLKAEGRSKKTLEKYANVFARVRDLAERRHLATILDVNLPAVDAYRHERVEAGAAPKTIYSETVIVRQLVNFALSRGRIATDPLKGLRIPEPKPTPQPCWSPEEVERILSGSAEPQRRAYMILADTGLRIAELSHLTWDDVDFDRNVLHVRPKQDWRPKTGDMRAIPMSPRVRRLIESLPRRHRWVLTAPPSTRYPKGDQRISERRLLVALKRVLKKLGLKGHLHTFRHAFISRSLTAGIPEAVVREWVGHVDRDVIRLYTHIASAASQEAMKRLSEGQTVREGPKATDGSNGENRSGTNSAQIQHTERSDHDDESAK